MRFTKQQDLQKSNESLLDIRILQRLSTHLTKM